MRLFRRCSHRIWLAKFLIGFGLYSTLVANTWADEAKSNEALDYLVGNRVEILLSIASESSNGGLSGALGGLVGKKGGLFGDVAKNSEPKYRGEPLTGLDGFLLGSSANRIGRELGEAVTAVELADGWKWIYVNANNEKLVFVFDLNQILVNIFTNRTDLKIPKKLTVGRNISEFEAWYGGRKHRTMKTISPNLRLLKYKRANLALVAEKNTGTVLSLMVFHQDSPNKLEAGNAQANDESKSIK